MTHATLTGHPSASLLSDPTLLLTRHLQQCHIARGRMFHAVAWAEAAHTQVAPRFVSTVSLVVLLLLACTW